MKIKIKETIGTDLKKIIQNQKIKTNLEVGIIQDGIHKSGVRIFDLADWLENGTEDTPPWRYNLWARLDAEKDVLKRIPEMSDLYLREGNIDNYVTKLGYKLVKDYIKTIEDIKFPHNSPATIKKKGFDDPLIETREFKTKPRARKDGGGIFG